MRTNVLIIGAGPAGTVASAILKKEGFHPLIIEKSVFPRFVIGESLLPRSMDVFKEAGLLAAIDRQNYQKKYGAEFIRNNETCTFEFSEQFTLGWQWTWQVPRDSFDKVLADEVVRQGVDIVYGATVTDVQFKETTSVTTIVDNKGNSAQIEADIIIDASGYGRVLPKLLDLEKPSSLPARNSLFTQIKDTNRPKGDAGERITIIDSKPGVWIWIIPFSNGNTSVGFVASPDFFNKYKGSNNEKLIAMIADEHRIAKRFNNTDFIFDAKFIEGYSTSVKQIVGPGFVLTGNATEFLDPIFSSGVTFAVESGMQAAKLVALQLKGESVNWNESYVKYMKHGVEVFRSYVNAWYDGTLQKIFFAKNENQKIKKQICSVLAGYVWDMKNPYVRNHKNALKTLVKFIDS